MQFQALRDKYAKKYGINSHDLDEYYFAERFIHRVSLSKYSGNFVFKGGFILSSLLGVDTRLTKDIDSVLVGIDFDQNKLEDIIREICDIQIDDCTTFEVVSSHRIAQEKGLFGFNVLLLAHFGNMKVYVPIDIVMYDVIEPTEISYKFPMMFDDDYISLMAYSIEGILTEKIDAVLVNGTRNTRMRDYYDIRNLFTIYRDKINKDELKKSLINLFGKQKQKSLLIHYDLALDNILCSEFIQAHWHDYQEDFEYANGLTLEDVIKPIRELLDWLFS